MAQPQHTPSLAHLEEALTVLFCLITLGVNCEITTRASRRRPTGDDRAAH